MPDRFTTHVLEPIRKATGHKVQATRRNGIHWGYDEGPEHREVQLVIEADHLAGTLRSEGAAAPLLALCLAAALDGTPGTPARASVEVTGSMPPLPGLGYRVSKQLLQFRRASFLLHMLAEILPERFHLTIAEESRWAWPEQTWLGVERYRKNKGRPDGGRDRLAYEMELGLGLHSSFCAEVEPIRRFQPHFPVVVHTGEVSKDSNWTVGGRAGAALWAASADHRRVHLFELEVGKRSTMGSLAEALCNAGLLVEVFDGTGHYDPVQAVGIAAVRKARRMVMWLTAEHYHPLIFDEGSGDSVVLTWINRALRTRNLQFGVLPWGGDVITPHFRFDARWGGGFRR